MPLRFAGLVLLSAALGSSSLAQSPPNISGVWVLNPALTQRPEEIGFNPGWARSGAEGSGEEAGEGSRGGRGRRGGAGARVPQVVRESADDSTRATQLTAEARTPPAHLTIVQAADSVSISDDQGLTRTFHPAGHLEELTLGTVSLPTSARWTAEGLEVVYDVESGWQLRYRYTPSADRTRLVVDIRFLQQGHEGDEVRLTYESPEAHEHTVAGDAPRSTRVPAAPAAAAVPGAAAPASAGAARPPVLPPGSELRGITTIGTVVDNLSPDAAACGLDQAKIKSSIARILADAGFKTQPLGDEETYVWVNVVTNRMGTGTCVSRYDASLMTQADATLPYLKGLVALDVPLLRDGGLTGGAAASHAKSVLDALAASVNRFITQIRGAAK
jgi:hypothetical protein